MDVVEENVSDARRNASKNGVRNAEFLCGRAEELVPRILGDMDAAAEAVAVVDPSRAGAGDAWRVGMDGWAVRLKRAEACVLRAAQRRGHDVTMSKHLYMYIFTERIYITFFLYITAYNIYIYMQVAIHYNILH